MCMAPRAPSPPPPPPAATLPPAPAISTVSARPQMQATPAKAAPPMQMNTEDTMIKRRGKRGMVIQLGSTAGTNIPGE